MPITFLTNKDYETLETIHGDLEDLQTNDKSSLVAAINEAANEQPDFNAAEGEAGYILNRTHWVDEDGTVHTLDEKFIPESIARVSDIPDITFTETDPTVPAWAKEANKPTYTADEVGADAAGTAAKALTDAQSYTNTAISNLINGAPTTLDTLGEIATAMAENADVVEALEDAIGSKANASDLTAHTGNTTVHITSDERTDWNAAKTHADSAHAPVDAEKNQNAFSKVTVGSTTIEADNATDTLTLVAGSNVTITPDAVNDTITIAVSDMEYTHPNSGVVAGTYKSVTVNEQGHVTGGTNPTTLEGYGITDAEPKGAANDALVAAKEYTDTAVTGKADADHDHNEVYYTKTEIDSLELITVADIDAICGTTIQDASEEGVTF